MSSPIHSPPTDQQGHRWPIARFAQAAEPRCSLQAATPTGRRHQPTQLRLLLALRLTPKRRPLIKGRRREGSGRPTQHSMATGEGPIIRCIWHPFVHLASCSSGLVCAAPAASNHSTHGAARPSLLLSLIPRGRSVQVSARPRSSSCRHILLNERMDEAASCHSLLCPCHLFPCARVPARTPSCRRRDGMNPARSLRIQQESLLSGSGSS